MNRRQATALLGTLVLAACGGGGGGGAATPDSSAGGSGAAPASAAGSTALRAPTTPNLALWGDSMVPPLSRALDLVFDDRQIFDGGVAGETSTQVLQRLLDDREHRDWITFFWFGHNDIRIDAASAPAQVKANLAKAIASLAPGNNDFIVLALVNNAVTAPAGSAEYETVLRLNEDLAATWPQNFFDIRRFMVEQADPGTAQGEADRRSDVPSSTLRGDEIHLNGFGAEVLAKRLQVLLQAYGW